MSKVLELFRSLTARIGVAVVIAGGLTLGLAATVVGTAAPGIAPTLASTTSCGYGGNACEDKLQAGMTALQMVPVSAGQTGATGALA